MNKAQRKGAEAARRAARRASNEWREAAWGALRRISSDGLGPFVTSQARHMVAVPTHDDRAWGGLLRRAAHAGLIKPTGKWRATGLIASHARPEREWQGVPGKPWPVLDE